MDLCFKKSEHLFQWRWNETNILQNWLGTISPAHTPLPQHTLFTGRSGDGKSRHVWRMSQDQTIYLFDGSGFRHGWRLNASSILKNYDYIGKFLQYRKTYTAWFSNIPTLSENSYNIVKFLMSVIGIFRQYRKIPTISENSYCLISEYSNKVGKFLQYRKIPTAWYWIIPTMSENSYVHLKRKLH